MTKAIKLPGTLEEVEQILAIDFKSIKEGFKALPVKALDQANAYHQFVWEKIIESINVAKASKKKDRWWPDWLNSSQYKYFPYAWLRKDESHPAGLGFAHSSYVDWFTSTYVGSRLLTEDSESALHAIRTFPNEYLAMTLFAKEGLS